MLAGCVVGCVAAAASVGLGVGASVGATRPAPTSAVIVLLRNEAPNLPDTPAKGALRARAIGSAQARLISAVRASGGRVTRQFKLIDAFAATVDARELASLKADRAVAQVIPNAVIPVPSGAAPAGSTAPAAAVPTPATIFGSQGDRTAGPKQVRVTSAKTVSAPVTAPPTEPAPVTAPPTGSAICSPNDPLIEPEALQLTHTAPVSASASTSGYETSTGIDGTGVKVGVIAYGVDPTLRDFRRDDGFGPSAVTDIDFTGLAVGSPQTVTGGPISPDIAVTSNPEGYGDASTIVAQGNETYDLSTVSPDANPAVTNPCPIKIRGLAPGASVQVYGVLVDANGQCFAATSAIIAAIDYAISIGHVNVLNESLGDLAIPSSVTDALEIANQQASAAGVTVVVAAGDAGPTNTIGNPADDPSVISAAASTMGRLTSQTAGYGAGLMSDGAGFQGGTNATPAGWVDNEPAGFSSSGLDQAGGVPDLIAPGDAGWALCSTNLTLYPNCPAAAAGGGGAGIFAFNGTSEAAPMTAAAAALVIQAYKQTHGGDLPAAALVKQILMSSAQDLGLPSAQQGAGLLNTYAAVQDAESIHVGSGGSGSAPAFGTLVSTSATPGTRPGQLDVIGDAGTTVDTTVTVTNTGATTEVISPQLRTLGVSGSTAGSTTLDAVAGDGAPTFTDGLRTVYAYKAVTFAVGAGTDTLVGEFGRGPDADIKNVQMTLIDPSGRFVGDATAFGGNTAYGRVDVAQPEAGTWTAYLWSPSGTGSSVFNGTVQYRFTSSAFSHQALDPSTVTLPAGATQTLSIPVTLPAAGGDANEDVVLSTALASAPGTVVATNVIPVAQRARIPLSATGGTFGGLATGGNGNQSQFAGGQIASYEFTVPAGKPALVVDTSLTGPGWTGMTGWLVDPAGEPMSIDTNGELDRNHVVASKEPSLENMVLNPIPGDWRYILAISDLTDRTTVNEPYNGTISFASPDAATPTNVPDSASTRIAPGGSMSATIAVANHGPTAQQLFIDARSTSVESIALQPQYESGGNMTLPNTGSAEALFTVPPDVSGLTAGIQSSAGNGIGAAFDLAGPQGLPAIASDTSGASGSASATLGTAPPLTEVAPGTWTLTADLVGPFTGPAPTGTATATLSAQGLGFDPNVSGGYDPFYSLNFGGPGMGTFTTISPATSGTLNVTFSPPAATKPGTVVSGTLNVVSWSSQWDRGDVLARIPYEYTVGTAQTVPSQSVLISSLRLIGPSGASDRYVALKNVTGSPISVSGWTLKLADQSVSSPISLSGTLAAGGTMIVADTGYRNSAAPATITRSFGGVSAMGGAQLDDASGRPVDAVGWADAPPGVSEGTPLTLPALPMTQYAWVRISSGGGLVNTGDNASDFAFDGSYTPASGGTASTGTTTGAQARIAKAAKSKTSVKLTLTCAGAKGTSCSLVVTLTARLAHGTTRAVGSHGVKIDAGRTRTVSISLSRTARRWLHAGHSLTVTVTVVTGSGTGKRTVGRRQLTFRPSVPRGRH
jgi:hypothetical protein